MALPGSTRCTMHRAFVDDCGEEAVLEFLECFPRHGGPLGPLSDRSRYRMFAGLVDRLGENATDYLLGCFRLLDSESQPG